jgi:hypothetical protein
VRLGGVQGRKGQSAEERQAVAAGWCVRASERARACVCARGREKQRERMRMHARRRCECRFKRQREGAEPGTAVSAGCSRLRFAQDVKSCVP